MLVCGGPYLYVAGLLHEPAGVLCSSVAFRELDSEELESPLKVCLQEVLLRCLERDMRRWWEEVVVVEGTDKKQLLKVRHRKLKGNFQQLVLLTAGCH